MGQFAHHKIQAVQQQQKVQRTIFKVSRSKLSKQANTYTGQAIRTAAWPHGLLYVYKAFLISEGIKVAALAQW